MEKLKHMKEVLANAVYSELGNLKEADTKELGEVVDMVKDLEEAIYYCTITKAMEEKEKNGNGHNSEKYYYYYPERDMDRPYGRMYFDDRMYYNGNGGSNGSNSTSNGNNSSNSSRNYTPMAHPYHNYPTMEYPHDYNMMEYPVGMRDSREGRSPASRRTYMESKEMHKDKAAKMQELEKYMQELTKDMVEMIEGASPEEKQLLQRKLTTLGNKIEQVNV